MSRGKLLAAILFTLALAGASSIAYAQTPSDYPYFIEIEIENTGGSAWTGPFPVTMNTENLIDGGFLESDGLNSLFTDSGNVEQGGSITNVASATSTWWMFADTLAGGLSTETIWLGGSTVAPHRFPFAETDSITVPDSAGLDISDDLTVEATFRAFSLPSEDVPIVDKGAAYRLLLNGSTVTGAVFDSSSTTSPQSLPTGDVVVNLTPSGCASHYQCVDDPIGAHDFGATVLTTTSGTYVEDTFTVAPFSIPTGAVITSVWLQAIGNSTSNPGGNLILCLVDGADETCSSAFDLNVAYETKTFQSNTNLQGEAWQPSDVTGLQAKIRVRNDFTIARVTQVYMTVVYIAPDATVSYSGVEAGTEVNVRMTYNNPDLTLYIDDIEEDSATGSGAIVANTDDVIVGPGFLGWVDDIQIGDTNVLNPQWVLQLDFEPENLSLTDAGDAGDGWTWEGVITDISAGGNDGTYEIVADDSLTVTVGGLQIQPDLTIITSDQQIADVAPSPPLGPFLSPVPTVSSPYMDGIRSLANNSTLPANTWWMLVGVFVSAAVMGRVMNIFPQMWITSIAGLAVFAVIALISGIQFMPNFALLCIWFVFSLSIKRYWRS